MYIYIYTSIYTAGGVTASPGVADEDEDDEDDVIYLFFEYRYVCIINMYVDIHTFKYIHVYKYILHIYKCLTSLLSLHCCFSHCV